MPSTSRSVCWVSAHVYIDVTGSPLTCFGNLEASNPISSVDRGGDLALGSCFFQLIAPRQKADKKVPSYQFGLPDRIAAKW
jgi:hypothetical protein